MPHGMSSRAGRGISLWIFAAPENAGGDTRVWSSRHQKTRVGTPALQREIEAKKEAGMPRHDLQAVDSYIMPAPKPTAHWPCRGLVPPTSTPTQNLLFIVE